MNQGPRSDQVLQDAIDQVMYARARNSEAMAQALHQNSTGTVKYQPLADNETALLRALEDLTWLRQDLTWLRHDLDEC